MQATGERPESRTVVVRPAWKALESHDQRVELGKVLAERIIPGLATKDEPKLTHDSSTHSRIRRYRQLKENA